MIDLADPARVYATKTIPARKPHRCDECGLTIQPGDLYERATMLYDDRWDTYRSCSECMEAEAWLTEQCGGFCHAGVLDDLRDHWAEASMLGLPPGGIVRLGRLLVAMNRRVHSANLAKLKEWGVA